MQGKTVVNIAIGRVFNDNLPGITICPGGVALDKLAKVNDKYSKYYEQYLTLVGKEVTSSEVILEITMLYHLINTDILADLTNGVLGFDIHGYMKDYSHSYLDQHNRTTITVTIAEFNQVPDVNLDKLNSIVRPVESLVSSLHLFKCFTFFSYLHEEWKLNKVNLDSIMMGFGIQLDPNTFPHNLLPFIFAMHSPEDLPIIENGKSKPVSINTIYLVQYSQYHIKRLGTGYDTNCRGYGRGKEYEIRSDCIQQCLQKYHDRICKEPGISLSYLLIREEFIQTKGKYLSHCPEYDRQIANMRSSCSSRCPFDCESKYYSFDLINTKKRNDSSTSIVFQHNQMPDITIQYIPEMSFISVVCYFGGILGMWLGVSFLSILNQVKPFLNRLRPNIHINKIQLFKIQTNGDSIMFAKRSISK